MKVLVRVELKDGSIKWRSLPDAERATHHGTLCAAFGLDPIRTSFDLPSTARGIGSASGDQRSRGLVNGYVLWATAEREKEPIGTITFVREGERIPDVDPTNRADFFKLERKVG